MGRAAMDRVGHEAVGHGRALLRPLMTLAVAAAVGVAVWQLLVHDVFVPERSVQKSTDEQLDVRDQRALERLLAQPSR